MEDYMKRPLVYPQDNCNVLKHLCTKSAKYILCKNREISIFMMREKVARLTPHHEAIERIKQGQIKQNKKHTLVWTKSANLMFVWGPSIVICMTVT
jgi:hypothetical protein